jgi:hypothetical protein
MLLEFYWCPAEHRVHLHNTNATVISSAATESGCDLVFRVVEGVYVECQCVVSGDR